MKALNLKTNQKRRKRRKKRKKRILVRNLKLKELNDQENGQKKEIIKIIGEEKELEKKKLM
jgi:hypothetical protein